MTTDRDTAVPVFKQVLQSLFVRLVDAGLVRVRNRLRLVVGTLNQPNFSGYVDDSIEVFSCTLQICLNTLADCLGVLRRQLDECIECDVGRVSVFHVTPDEYVVFVGVVDDLTEVFGEYLLRDINSNL